MNKTASMVAQPDPYWIEARAYCARHIREHDEKDVEALAASLRHKAFMDKIRPLLDMKARVYNCTIPKITIDPNEPLGVRSEYVFAPDMQKILDECDKHIAEIASRFGVSSTASAQRQDLQGNDNTEQNYRNP